MSNEQQQPLNSHQQQQPPHQQYPYQQQQQQPLNLHQEQQPPHQQFQQQQQNSQQQQPQYPYQQSLQHPDQQHQQYPYQQQQQQHQEFTHDLSRETSKFSSPPPPQERVNYYNNTRMPHSSRDVKEIELKIQPLDTITNNLNTVGKIKDAVKNGLNRIPYL